MSPTTEYTNSPVLIELLNANGQYLDRFYGRFATDTDTTECELYGTVPTWEGTVIGVFASAPNKVVHVTPNTILELANDEQASQYTLYPHPSTKVGLSDGDKYQIIRQAHANKWVYNP